MKLIIGGFAQGKLEYVTRKIKDKYCVIDETSFCLSDIRTATGTGTEKSAFYKAAPMSEKEASADPSVIRRDGRETDGEVPSVIIVNHLHQIVRKAGGRESVKIWIRDLAKVCVKRGQDLILISDEVGNGVIPVDTGERKYREDVGRLLCELAGEADCVERIICGLPQILKNNISNN